MPEKEISNKEVKRLSPQSENKRLAGKKDMVKRFNPRASLLLIFIFLMRLLYKF